MADHPLIATAAAENGLVEDTLLDALVKRMPLTIGPTEDLVDIVQSIGSAPLTIISAATGQVFFYDAADATTPDDGVTCLVDGLGRRYKASDAAVLRVSSVLAIEDTPPGSPSLGDAYVVDVAPSGAWAANAKDIAIYTQRGWVFAAPQVGVTVLNVATGDNIQYSSAGSWGAFSVTNESLGQHTIWMPASAMVPATTNGAAAGTAETTTNKVMVKTLDFSTSTEKFAQFMIQMPKSWDEGTLIAQFIWTHGSTTTNFGVAWGLEAVAFANDDALDTAWGTEVATVDTGGTTNDCYISPESTAVTVAGSPAAEELVAFRVTRVVGNASDNMAVDAKLIGVKIHYTTNAGNDD